MTYAVKEIFYTLQGEGANAGRPAVFCRFAGCNLWTGREANGTVTPPPGIDWLCVSPKADAPLVVTTGDELKLVYPQDGAEPQRYEGLGFRHFFLQPMDGPAREANTRHALHYCLSHPRWRLSLQTHKLLGIP